ncbi:protein of unknown function [Azospirillum baldaniorum]|uniref:Uncharacterized protein n=1 Tax=Azospirillum baldaniorum TaxID=1064539 RepID=A0A9P1JR05_9PROT|nr:protein of unknown function [Azospirillum baldaniorum]
MWPASQTGVEAVEILGKTGNPQAKQPPDLSGDSRATGWDKWSLLGRYGLTVCRDLVEPAKERA